jgi:hypothetical protein
MHCKSNILFGLPLSLIINKACVVCYLIIYKSTGYGFDLYNITHNLLRLFHQGFQYIHRLNMELDLQSWLHVYSCTPWLRPRNSPPPPAFGLKYKGVIGQSK